MPRQKLKPPTNVERVANFGGAHPTPPPRQIVCAETTAAPRAPTRSVEARYPRRAAIGLPKNIHSAAATAKENRLS
jgi:hypothetical protein